MPLDALLAVFQLPGVQVALALLIAAVIGVIVRSQVARLGLDTVPLLGISTWRWSSLAGTLTFWLSAVLLVQIGARSLPGASTVVLMLSRLGLAGGCLLLASWLVEARTVSVEDSDRETRARVEAERWPILAAGAAAAAVSLAGGSAVLLVVAAVGLLGLLLLTDSGPSRSLGSLLTNLGAGVTLRTRLQPGQAIDIDGVEHVVRSRPGLLATWVEAADSPREARDNTTLLANLETPIRRLPEDGA